MDVIEIAEAGTKIMAEDGESIKSLTHISNLGNNTVIEYLLLEEFLGNLNWKEYKLIEPNGQEIYLSEMITLTIVRATWRKMMNA